MSFETTKYLLRKPRIGLNTLFSRSPCILQPCTEIAFLTMICPTPEIDAPLELYSNYSRTKRDTSLQEGRGDDYYDDSDRQTLIRSKREVMIPPDQQFQLGFVLDDVREYAYLLRSRIKDEAYIIIHPMGPTIEGWESPKLASDGSFTIEV